METFGGLQMRKKQAMGIFRTHVCRPVGCWANAKAGEDIVIIYSCQKSFMCLAYPGKVVSVSGNEGVIDFGGVRKKARLDLVEVKKGDYVIVHTGFAIEKVDRRNAELTIKLIRGEL
jgi:hydrogenase expression/formation protein HypC